MIAYKLMRQRVDGSLGSLYIGKSLKYLVGETYRSKPIRTKGFAYRPGFHLLPTPHAPHLSTWKRVWVEAKIKGHYDTFKRPEAQGGRWLLAKQIKILRIVDLKEELTE